MKTLTLRAFLFLAALSLAPRLARADYVTNHYGGHGPLAMAGATPSWGVVEMWSTTGERWLGDLAGSYSAYPTSGATWVKKSSAPNTYAVAYEHASYPFGRTFVVTSSWVNLGWAPALVGIQYDDGCPLTPGMNTVHVCAGDWTPLDSGNVPTYVVGNGIVKPGLPYGDYLKDTSGTGAASWCSFNFSDFPGVTKPTGAPNHGVAIDACP